MEHRNSVGHILAGDYLVLSQMPSFSGAACYDNSIDPESYFPVNTLTGDNRAAKKVCKTCPVRSECLEYALENFISFGIWGGLTGPERVRLRWKRKHERNNTFGV